MFTYHSPPSGADNVRMAMETCAVFAHATGRTLVLPPSQPLYLLHLKNKRHSFGDFFPLEDIPADTLEVSTIHDTTIRLRH